MPQICHVSCTDLELLLPLIFDFRNHPVIKSDGVLTVFLTTASFEEWRKNASISLEEESASKRIDRVEEMSIPSDLEEKITCVHVSHSYSLD